LRRANHEIGHAVAIEISAGQRHAELVLGRASDNDISVCSRNCSRKWTKESVCSARSHAAGPIVRRADSYIAKPIAVKITDTDDRRAKQIAIDFTSQDRIGIRSLDIAAKCSIEDIGFVGAGSEKLVCSDNDVRNTVAVNVLTAGLPICRSRR